MATPASIRIGLLPENSIAPAPIALLEAQTYAVEAARKARETVRKSALSGGGLPGKTSRVTGTINGSSYSITWTSQIVGGPFNNFTGLWHLTGTYSK